MDFAAEGRMDLDVTPTEDPARRGVLDEAIFPAFSNDAGSASVGSPAQLQKDDPLGTQIWKLYARAKTQLPNSERMENLSWRLMSLNMRRAEQARNRGYECRHVLPPCCLRDSTLSLCGTHANGAFAMRRLSQSQPQMQSQDSPGSDIMPPPASSARPKARTAPSGIAQQLRKSSEQQMQAPQPQPQPQSLAPPDTMNLDDFIFPSSVGSPAGLSPEPSNETPGPFDARAPAIAIRKPHQASDHAHAHNHDFSLAHASAPSVPPLVSRENEFGYVPRHVRKTSIDERRVSVLSSYHASLHSTPH